MRPNLAPDSDLAARLFAAIRAASFDGVGVTRDAYGPGEQAAHDLVRAEAAALGLETRTDAAGNLYMTLPGADRAAKRIVFGSHLDSVPQGGDYDGTAGVLAGLAVLAGLRGAGFTPAQDLTVIANRAEEVGAWFPALYPGSNAALGRLPASALTVRRLDTGRTLAEHMIEAGFDPQAAVNGPAVIGPHNTAAYVELHIEQGSVLEAEGLPLGIVTGIPGTRRWRSARVLGEYNHSGATPRRYRRDAAIALAELALRLDEAWAALEATGQAMVCTFCVLETPPPAGFTKIAGEARFQLDLRSVSEASLDALEAELHRLVAAIEARRGVRFELGPRASNAPSPMDGALRDGLGGAAQALGLPCRAMASGAGHDAAAFADAGVPSAMLFVRNQHGSHNPQEAMRLADFAAGCAVLMHWVVGLGTTGPGASGAGATGPSGGGPAG